TAYTLICGTSPRPFAHQAITELPAAISSQTWAGSLLDVLEKATQTRAGDRYQTVQDFWDDLNDVAMPVTQPLAMAVSRHSSPSFELNVDEVLTAAAPPRPQFETSREIRQQQMQTNRSAAARPRIVVPIAGHQAPPNAQVAGVNQAPGRLTVPVRNALPAAPPAVAPRRKRSRDFVVGLVLVLCFAGLLAATGAYVR